MAIQTIKFSEFTSGGDLENNNTTVGIESADNARFNNPWTFLAPGTTAARPAPAANMYYRLRLNTTMQLYEYYDPILVAWIQINASGGVVTIEGTQDQVLVNGGFGVPVAGAIVLTLPQDIATTSDVTFNSVATPFILDSNGLPLFQFVTAPGSVNYLGLANSATGQGPTFAVLGTDANAGLFFLMRGTGQFVIDSANPTPFTINSGTLFQHTSNFIFANTAATRNITFPDASGTVAFTSGINPWVDQTTASVTMAVNTGYTSDAGASLITFTLPATSAIGDYVEINGKGAGGWIIAQAAGQQIDVGNVASTLGVGGSVASSNQFDCIRLRCITADTIWTTVSQQSAGLTIV